VRREAGDLLLLDNRVTMHGREPFEVERQVFVAFAQLTALRRSRSRGLAGREVRRGTLLL
jgi:Taurine catabolism dioxygenase TauD, TfdA family